MMEWLGLDGGERNFGFWILDFGLGCSISWVLVRHSACIAGFGLESDRE
jgi:hypothetical protein